MMTNSHLSIAASFQVHGKHSTVSQLDARTGDAEYFDQLKAGVIEWRRALPEGAHSLSIFTTLAQAERQRVLAQKVCDQWNADPTLSSLDANIEISFGTDEDVSTGCTTYDDPVYKKGRRELHVIDYQAILARVERETESMREEERQRRRTNPVQRPVALPLWIRWEIASYLRLEYGESFWERDSVKPWQLRYVGEIAVDGVPTRYWTYPTSDGKPHYATVERFDNSYSLGMTADPPPAPSK